MKHFLSNSLKQILDEPNPDITIFFVSLEFRYIDAALYAAIKNSTATWAKDNNMLQYLCEDSMEIHLARLTVQEI